MPTSFNHIESLCRDAARLRETLSTTYWAWVLTEGDPELPSLERFLCARLPHINPNSWRSRFDFGGIYVNGRASLEDHTLGYPCKVEYYEPKFEISQASSIFPQFQSDFILYSDDDIVVAYKPPKLPSMPAKEQRHFSLKAYLEKYLNRVVHMPSRLDVSAQGLLIVSISARAHAPLQRAFESRRIKKGYQLATTGTCLWLKHTADLKIARDPLHPVLRTVSSEHGKSALTIFERSHTARSEDYDVTVLRASPVSGRTHQIRVHAAHAGIPIIGDNFYGGAHASYLHLVSYELQIEHPITKEHLSFELPSSLRPDWMADASS